MTSLIHVSLPPAVPCTEARCHVGGSQTESPTLTHLWRPRPEPHQPRVNKILPSVTAIACMVLVFMCVLFEYFICSGLFLIGLVLVLFICFFHGCCAASCFWIICSLLTWLQWKWTRVLPAPDSYCICPNRKSTTGFPASYIDEVRMLSYRFPKWWFKKCICRVCE